MGKALAENMDLKILDLGGNNIGPEGASLLSSALRGHKALRSLELGYNPLGPEGLKAISDVIKYELKVRRTGNSHV